MPRISEISLALPDEFGQHDILFVVSFESSIYVLFMDSKLAEFDYIGNMKKTVETQNSKLNSSVLYVDDLYVYIGYENGTTEVRDRIANLSYLKTTSIKDPGGPGNAKITGILATDEFLLVNTVENGLLIYIKPAILFYKWIMIELETTIKSFAIDRHLLFVLTIDNEIHLLNFIKQRLDEVPIGGFEYTDIEFDGKYLYIGSRRSLHIYDYHNNCQLIFSRKFDSDKLSVLIKIENTLLIVFDNNRAIPLLIDITNSKSKFSIGSSIILDKIIPISVYKNMKTSFKGVPLKDPTNNKYIWSEDNILFEINFGFYLRELT